MWCGLVTKKIESFLFMHVCGTSRIQLYQPQSQVQEQALEVAAQQPGLAVAC
jgi:hypothetical protein